jgi:hypothetical protein
MGRDINKIYTEEDQNLNKLELMDKIDKDESYR